MKSISISTLTNSIDLSSVISLRGKMNLISQRQISYYVTVFFRRMSRVCNPPRISATKSQRRAKDERDGRSTCGLSNWNKNHRPARCNKIHGSHFCQNISATFRQNIAPTWNVYIYLFFFFFFLRPTLPLGAERRNCDPWFNVYQISHLDTFLENYQTEDENDEGETLPGNNKEPFVQF